VAEFTPRATPEPDEPDKYRALRRELRSRRRDDFALTLFRQAEATLGDIPRVDRILVELGRCYNPMTNTPIVSLATRRRIVECLQQGCEDEARQLLDDCLVAYARVEPPAGAPESPSRGPGEPAGPTSPDPPSRGLSQGQAPGRGAS
jgi:hypothetical protein